MWVHYASACSSRSRSKAWGDLQRMRASADAFPCWFVMQEYCSRRILVTEWIDGCKLIDCSPEEIKELIPLAQEVFLTQLLQVK